MKEYCKYHKKKTRFIPVGWMRINDNIMRVTFKCKKCFKDGIYLEIEEWIKKRI